VKNDIEVMWRVMMEGRPRRPAFDGTRGFPMSDALWALVQRCWMHQPSDRLKMDEVVGFMKANMFESDLK
jgi:hypothetical protein